MTSGGKKKKNRTQGQHVSVCVCVCIQTACSYIGNMKDVRLASAPFPAV